MKKEVVLKTCYSLLRRKTPLQLDCGKLCGGKCCKGDDKTGMLLFPGEENLIDSEINIIENEGVKLAVCKGTCDRNKRPLSCRIYPLFPLIYVNEKGEEAVKVVFDCRADCPLSGSEYKFDKKFVRAVRRVGKYLLLNDETAEFYRNISEQITETADLYNKLLK